VSESDVVAVHAARRPLLEKLAEHLAAKAEQALGEVPHVDRVVFRVKGQECRS